MSAALHYLEVGRVIVGSVHVLVMNNLALRVVFPEVDKVPDVILGHKDVFKHMAVNVSSWVLGKIDGFVLANTDVFWKSTFFAFGLKNPLGVTKCDSFTDFSCSLAPGGSHA